MLDLSRNDWLPRVLKEKFECRNDKVILCKYNFKQVCLPKIVFQSWLIEIYFVSCELGISLFKS